MTDRIRAFFERKMKLPSSSGGNGAENVESAAAESAAEDVADGEARHRLHLAACALLLELAHADDEFSAVEEAHIEAVLRRHFSLDEAEARELMELAESERASAIDLFQFTRLIRSSYDLGQKTLLAEVMWGLILADGEIARHEAYLLRKIANLLDLEPGYLSAARERAADEEGPPDERPGGGEPTG